MVDVFIVSFRSGKPPWSWTIDQCHPDQNKVAQRDRLDDAGFEEYLEVQDTW